MSWVEKNRKLNNRGWGAEGGRLFGTREYYQPVHASTTNETILTKQYNVH